MNAEKSIVALAVTMLALSSCKKEPSYEKENFTEVQMGMPLNDVRIPNALWDRFESKLKHLDALSDPGKKPEEHSAKPEAEHAEKAEAHGEPAKEEGHSGGHDPKPDAAGVFAANSFQGSSVRKEPMAVKMFLVEKTKGVLGGKNWELIFPKGGGELDLSKYVSEKRRGTFSVMAIPIIELGEKEQVFAFFASNSKRRTLEAEPFGSGCGTYLELTKFYSQVLSQTGFEVNTTDKRYASTLGGTLYLVVPRGNILNVGYITVSDSRYPEFYCKVAE